MIGINAQIRSDSGGSSGIGFAVPIDSARRSLADLLAHGRVAYAYAGLQTQDLTPSLAQHLHLSVLHGALIERVTPGGPAARAGLRGGSGQIQFEGEQFVTGGDVIVSVDGHAREGRGQSRADRHKQAPARTDGVVRDRPRRQAPQPSPCGSPSVRPARSAAR